MTSLTGAPPAFGIVSGPLATVQNPQMTTMNASITKRIEPFPQAIVDQDPITFGIQTQPQSILPTAPLMMNGSVQSQPFTFGGMPQQINQYPIDPGFQGASGAYPQSVVGQVGARKWYNCCPWWLWVLLIIGVLCGFIGVVFALRPSRDGLQ